jgi:hypothetical protein
MILLSGFAKGKKKRKKEKKKEKKRREEKRRSERNLFLKNAVKDPRPRRYRQFTLTRRYMGMYRSRGTIPCGGLMFIHDTAKWIMKYDYT